MIYLLRHVTSYAYRDAVTHARCVLRLTPATGEGQRVLSHQITIQPHSHRRATGADFFGNATTTLTVETPHRAFRIEALSRIDVDRSELPDLASGLAWEEVRERVLAHPSLAPHSPVHFAGPSRRVPLAAEVTAYARASFPPGGGLYAGAVDLMRRIHADFTFDAGATDVATPVAQAFAGRRGVCQDFAHIMIAGLRGLGLPAAYVSGYLRTRPPPGMKRLEGADASHAWVSVWCGDGWHGLDPTNAVAVEDDHIVLATGRDYADVAPVAGIIAGSGSQRLTVAVDVVPEEEARDLAAGA
ncbi:transglutaminase domain protein [Methylobacterium sp. 4-46]|uniref:transglutaminase family protein n=1 Tax=unclassified Methylobacterium TaxID=2615210 RepID=UPI000152CE81|nr:MULTISPECIES: transglutaminase family protein [Methylobacterium]ACA19403.1 transglutaminase domain protein [Methylobacterium sp. 4-46]WFT78601.1 transglutaminase family protein [Methylobacterium nodulans]